MRNEGDELEGKRNEEKRDVMVMTFGDSSDLEEADLVESTDELTHSADDMGG